jgi:pyruvate dehydrogenase E2 component (dihydrolipoamide acetyltransferase)
MPAMEMAQEAATLVRWLKAEGERVNKGEPLMEIETDKALVEIEAQETGILAGLIAQDGQKIEVGRVIGLLLTEQEYLDTTNPPESGAPVTSRTQMDPSSAKWRAAPTAEKPESMEQPGSESISPRLRPASPKARRLAAQRGIDISILSGSGPEGGVTFVDLPQTAPRAPSAPEADTEYSVVSVTGMRAIIAQRLQRSYQVAPHIALTVPVEMREVLQLIETWNKKRAATSPLKITSVLAKAVAMTLLRFPRLNGHFVGDEIREYKSVHLGVAVALDDGLLVPTLRDAGSKALAVIQSELDDLFARARGGRLRRDELSGSTFTISNLGMFGIEQFSAILNPPEVGILSVGAVKDIPTVVNGKLASCPIMRATLNADHRAVDGAVGARFLDALKEILENPNPLVAGLGETGA